MKKNRILSILCIAALLIVIFGCVAVSAASDLTVSSDRKLTSKFNAYDNVIVKSGATLTLSDRPGESAGLEIRKSLVVEDGAGITGDGLLIFNHGAQISGMPLYYKYGGKISLIPDCMQLDNLGGDSDYKPEFYFDKAEKKYILNAEFNGGDPFEVELSERMLRLTVKEKHQLTLSGMTKGIKWTSGDESVVTVKNGLVTAKKTGSTFVSAEYNDRKCVCEIEVAKKGLNVKALDMNSGEEFCLQLTGTKLKSISSSDKKVARVTKKLKVKAVGTGTCTITAKCTNGKKYKCTIRVNGGGNQPDNAEQPAEHPSEQPAEQKEENK